MTKWIKKVQQNFSNIMLVLLITNTKIKILANNNIFIDRIRFGMVFEEVSQSHQNQIKVIKHRRNKL